VAPVLRLPIHMTVYAGLSSFAVDNAGEPYLCVLGDNDRGTGTLQKLVRAPRAERPAPATLSATGLFADTARLQPSPALFPYAVNAPFWSDHADKSRWLFVPPDRTIGFQPAGNWTFPAGTVAVKHFDLNTDERDPARRRRLETRVLVVDRAGGAYGRTYKWRADGTDADLLTGPVTERLTTTSKRPFGPLQTATLGGRPAGQAAPAADGALALQAPPGRTVFAHLTEAGDFDVAARFEAGAGATAGWMLRRQIEEQAPYLQVSWEAAGAGGNPAARLRLEVRARPGGPLSVSRHDGGRCTPWPQRETTHPSSGPCWGWPCGPPAARRLARASWPASAARCATICTRVTATAPPATPLRPGSCWGPARVSGTGWRRWAASG
jgi:hypothetical protein